MNHTEQSRKLTHKGAMAMLSAAVAEAETIGQPQCIVIVDASAVVLAELRMTGSKVLSRQSALTKAQTAASIQGPSNAIPEGVRIGIAMATDGRMTGLPGGLPIIVDGVCLGGIGVGSGSGDQDIAVAQAALRAIGAEL